MREGDVKKSEAKDRLHQGAMGDTYWGAPVRASSAMMRAVVSEGNADEDGVGSIFRVAGGDAAFAYNVAGGDPALQGASLL